MWYITQNETAPFAAAWSNIDGPRDYHTKQSKSERERQVPYGSTYMWNLNRDMSKLNLKQKQTHRHREQTCDCPVGGVWGEGRIGSLGFADANYYIQNG